MKIAINGDIINTKNIYEITKIEKDLDYDCDYYFRIIFFNNTIKYVTIDCEGIETLEFCQEKLSKFRDSIIKIWSENQSDIPQFNL